MAPSFTRAEAEWSCHRLPLRIAASGTTLTDRSGFYFILSDIVFILHCCAFTMSQCLYCFRVWWDGRFRSSNEYLNLLAKSRDPRGQFLTPGASLLACFQIPLLCSRLIAWIRCFQPIGTSRNKGCWKMSRNVALSTHPCRWSVNFCTYGTPH